MFSDLLRAQMFLRRHRVVAATLDRRIVGDDHHLLAMHNADAGDDAGTRHLVVIHAEGGEGGELHEEGVGIAEQTDTVAHQQLAALQMFVTRRRVMAAGDVIQILTQIIDEELHVGSVLHELIRGRFDFRFDHCHICLLLFSQD